MVGDMSKLCREGTKSDNEICTFAYKLLYKVINSICNHDQMVLQLLCAIM